MRESCPTSGDTTETEFLAQAVRELVAAIPWGHHANLLARLTDPAARLYYLRATARFGWSRNVLLNQIKAGAYERSLKEGKAHNFPAALPEHLAEQAEEALKSSYNLEFLGIARAVKERELEARLTERLRDFILELGYGFCFVGRQHRLTLGRKEYFIDLLFYHRFIKALVAIDLKVGPFAPEFAGASMKKPPIHSGAGCHIDLTGAKGLIANAGRYGGTYAHKDIAFDFCSWVSPEFKLYLIKEFQRLKDDENRRLSLAWNLQSHPVKTQTGTVAASAGRSAAVVLCKRRPAARAGRISR